MRKVLVILLSFIVLAACGTNDESTKKEEKKATNEEKTETSEENEDGTSLDVDKNLLSVEITVPANMVEDIADTVAQGEEEGFEVTENEDGSLTYKMSKARHKELMDELKENFQETLDEIALSEDFASIEEIMANDDFTEFTMVVDKEMYENSMDVFATIPLGMAGAIYMLFDGQEPDSNFNIQIHMENAENGEVFDTVKFPEDFEDEESQQMERRKLIASS